jgi:GNAT superfamily N-acetyltransferase
MRGKGLGRMLLKEVAFLAKEKGCTRLRLLNRRTRASYERGFYRKAGWEEHPEMASFMLELK